MSAILDTPRPEPARPSRSPRPGAAGPARPRRRDAPGQAIRGGVHPLAAELRPAGQPGRRREPHAHPRDPVRVHVHLGRDAGLRLPGRGPRRLADVLAPPPAGRGAALRDLDDRLLRPRPGPARDRERDHRRRPLLLAAAQRLRPALLPGRAAAVLPDLPGLPVAAPAHRAAPLVAARHQRGRGGRPVHAGTRVARAALDAEPGRHPRAVELPAVRAGGRGHGLALPGGARLAVPALARAAGGHGRRGGVQRGLVPAGYPPRARVPHWLPVRPVPAGRDPALPGPDHRHLPARRAAGPGRKPALAAAAGPGRGRLLLRHLPQPGAVPDRAGHAGLAVAAARPALAGGDVRGHRHRLRGGHRPDHGAGPPARCPRHGRHPAPPLASPAPAAAQSPAD